MAESTGRGDPPVTASRSPRIAWHLLALVLAAMVPFLVLVVYFSGALIEQKAAEAANDIRRSATVTATSVERLVSRVRTLLARMALRERVIALDAQACDPALATTLALSPEFTNVFTVTLEGRRVCSALPVPPGTSDMVDPALFLDAARASRGFTLGAPGVGRISRKRVAYVVAPVLREGEFVGVVGVGLDLSAVTVILDPKTLPVGGAAALVNRAGTVVTRYPDAEKWIGFDAKDVDVVRRALAGETGAIDGVGIDGIERIWARAPVPGTDWMVIAGIPPAAYVEAPRDFAAWIIGISLAMTIAVILLAHIAARRIAAPIEAMAAAAPRLGDDGAQPLVESGPAEIATLAHELNRRSDERTAMERRLRDANARVEGLIDSAMDAVLTIDSQHRVTLFNRAAEVMFGLPAAEVLGGPMDRLIPPRLRGRHPEHMANFENGTGTSRRMGQLGTVLGMRANGEEFPIEVSLSHVTVAGERTLTAIVRDISDRVKAELDVRMLAASLEQRVAERTVELEAANQELQAFDYSISHDLRGPLGRIRGFAAVLREDYGAHLDSQAHGYLERIEATGREMDGLVNDMLELSTVTQREIQRMEVDLESLAWTVVRALRESPAGAGIEVEVVVQPRLVAHADPGLMRIVLDNLLGNAWKFTSRCDRPRIEFAAADIDARRRAFFVRDNGAGFDPARAGKLFQPFRRLHTKSEFPGTGVGLATVSRIVRRHGGRVWAESAPGAGATFYFTLES